MTNNTKRKVQREMARSQHFPEPFLIVPHPHHTWWDPLGETARSSATCGRASGAYAERLAYSSFSLDDRRLRRAIGKPPATFYVQLDLYDKTHDIL